VRLVGVGDSLTVGIAYHKGSILSQVPAAAQLSYEGLGKSGAPIARFAVPLDSPEFVHLMGGTNDVLSGHSSSQMLVDLSDLIARIRKASGGKTYIILLHTPLLSSNVTLWNGKAKSTASANAELAAYNEGLDSFANEQTLSVVDAGIGEVYLGSDGIHLTAAGYDRIAVAIGQRVDQVVRTLGFWSNPARALGVVGWRNLVLMELAFWGIVSWGLSRQKGKHRERKKGHSRRSD